MPSVDAPQPSPRTDIVSRHQRSKAKPGPRMYDVGASAATSRTAIGIQPRRARPTTSTSTECVATARHRPRLKIRFPPSTPSFNRIASTLHRRLQLAGQEAPATLLGHLCRIRRPQPVWGYAAGRSRSPAAIFDGGHRPGARSRKKPDLQRLRARSPASPAAQGRIKANILRRSSSTSPAVNRTAPGTSVDVRPIAKARSASPETISSPYVLAQCPSSPPASSK